jgi:hypothetical protein
MRHGIARNGIDFAFGMLQYAATFFMPTINPGGFI